MNAFLNLLCLSLPPSSLLFLGLCFLCSRDLCQLALKFLNALYNVLQFCGRLDGLVYLFFLQSGQELHRVGIRSW